MRSIGIRELRQQASRYLRDVERGETIEVTDRGRPVAHLTPVPMPAEPEGVIARLRREGRITGPSRPLGELPPPLPPEPGVPLPSEILRELREDER